jgi:hypothetical protein
MTQIFAGALAAALLLLVAVTAARAIRKWYRHRQLSRELQMLREAAYRERPHRRSVVM